MLYPVIHSGDCRSRVWPVSKEAYPKPLMKLVDGKPSRKTYRPAGIIP